MKQHIYSGNPTTLLSSSTIFANVDRNYLDPISTTENLRSHIITTSGTFRKLNALIASNAGAGKSYTFTLYKNGVATNLSVLISGGSQVSGSDYVNSFAVAQGDFVSMGIIPTNVTSLRAGKWALEFEGDTANESIIMGRAVDVNYTTGIKYTTLHGLNSSVDTTESNRQQVISAYGSIKKLQVVIDTAPGLAETRIFTLRVNAADTALTTTIGDLNISGSDYTNSVSVVPGDLVALKEEGSALAFDAFQARYGVVFASNTDGESVILGGTANDLDVTGTEYTPLSADGVSIWTGTEDNTKQLTKEGAVLKKFYMNLTTAPGADKSYTFNVQTSGSSTGIGFTMSGSAATSGSDLVNTYSTLPFGTVNLKVVPAGTPGLADARWGIVQYIAPTASSLSGSQVNIGDSWRAISSMQVNVGDVWKNVVGLQINVSDVWKTATI